MFHVKIIIITGGHFDSSLTLFGTFEVSHETSIIAKLWFIVIITELQKMLQSSETLTYLIVAVGLSFSVKLGFLGPTLHLYKICKSSLLAL